MSEIVYVLTNPAMPDLIKIGKTDNLEQRVKQLSGHAGVPIPFEVHYACTVENASEVEKKVHHAFGDHRINARREFFEINPERVVSALELAALEDVTPGTDYVEDADEKAALDNERDRSERKRSHFKFSSVGIDQDAVLTFIHDEEITATVIDDRKIRFENKDASLSAAAQEVLQRMGRKALSIAGPQYWKYGSETLSERRNRLEEEEEKS